MQCATHEKPRRGADVPGKQGDDAGQEEQQQREEQAAHGNQVWSGEIELAHNGRRARPRPSQCERLADDLAGGHAADGECVHRHKHGDEERSTKEGVEHDEAGQVDRRANADLRDAAIGVRLFKYERGCLLKRREVLSDAEAPRCVGRGTDDDGGHRTKDESRREGRLGCVLVFNDGVTLQDLLRHLLAVRVMVGRGRDDD